MKVAAEEKCPCFLYDRTKESSLLPVTVVQTSEPQCLMCLMYCVLMDSGRNVLGRAVCCVLCDSCARKVPSTEGFKDNIC